MELSRQADYAIRAVLDLALQEGSQRTPSAAVARRQSIPGAFLTKILARLAAAGLIETQRGVGGGAWLARPAETISLLDVVEAVDGPITLNRCTWRPSECPRDVRCAVHPVWAKIRDDLREQLAGIDFAALASDARRMAAEARRGEASR